LLQEEFVIYQLQSDEEIPNKSGMKLKQSLQVKTMVGGYQLSLKLAINFEEKVTSPKQFLFYLIQM